MYTDKVGYAYSIFYSLFTVLYYEMNNTFHSTLPNAV